MQKYSIKQTLGYWQNKFGLVSAVALIFILGLVLLFWFFDLQVFMVGSKELNRKVLDHSLQLGIQFMLRHQKAEGNFNYGYDWIKKEFSVGDSQVRQAGAMWGLSLIYRVRPNSEVRTAVEKAMAFFEKHSKTTSDGRRYVVYPDDTVGSTGTVALCALAYIDYLRAASKELSEEKLQRYHKHLNEYIQFLINARTEEGLWHRFYHISDGKPYGTNTPYYDGESLLALVKAAKYMERTELKPLILDAADAGYSYNILQALQKEPDSRITKGYYQWSSMAFYELCTSGWQDTEKYGDYVIELADWMIDVHETLKRTRNTAYAYEGIIHAYELAVQRQDTKRIKKYFRFIEKGLSKLTSWQVGSPLENRFIRRHKNDDQMALGGIQNHRRESFLRIDVVQHQMHAVILARRYVYK